MNYRLEYWDVLFKHLIGHHLANGNNFDDFISYYAGKAYFRLERVDHNSGTVIPFLRYTFVSENGNSVVYQVNAMRCGSGTTTVIGHVSDFNGEIQLLDGPNQWAEEIMRECYLFAVHAMQNHWYV